MNAVFSSSRRIAAALFLGLVVAACASGPNAPSPELTQRIESARTRADHEALVAYYEKEARTARAVAEEHRKLAKSYGIFQGGRGGASMAAHCNAIVRSQEAIAAEYDAMAAAHKDMAKQAQP